MKGNNPMKNREQIELEKYLSCSNLAKSHMWGGSKSKIFKGSAKDTPREETALKMDSKNPGLKRALWILILTKIPPNLWYNGIKRLRDREMHTRRKVSLSIKVYLGIILLLHCRSLHSWRKKLLEDNRAVDSFVTWGVLIAGCFSPY